jgi:hypothetical protein
VRLDFIKENGTMRTIMTVTFLAAVLAAPSAFAQAGSPGPAAVNKPICRISGSAEKECLYDTMEQCEASKRGNTDFCQPNNGTSQKVPE